MPEPPGPLVWIPACPVGADRIARRASWTNRCALGCAEALHRGLHPQRSAAGRQRPGPYGPARCGHGGAAVSGGGEAATGDGDGPGSLGHRVFLMTMMATMFFGAGLIPTYLLVQSLGLTDTYLSLILPSAVSVFNILVLRAFFMGISPELTESARIDGASDLRILLTIIMPLSRAVLAVISLFYAVGYWSAWFNASIYLTDQQMMPLQNVLIQLVQKNTEAPTGLQQAVRTGQLSSLGLQMAVMVLALIPVAVASPFVQRHFKKGMLTGAIKG
ncbi:Binding-protein-dependent transport system inner membrane component [Streptomyces sp. OV198]|nr:Binding-protein-dependent transport system inner membrane component [Streptomyces sp. OV198]